MTQRLVVVLTCVLIHYVSNAKNNSALPNIVVLVIDDLGFADVGFNNNKINTPHIDKLAFQGTILTSYYTTKTCSSTRASLISGKFAHNTGINDVLLGHNPYGLDATHVLLTHALKEYGYHNILVGKWHLGYSRREFTPMGKGFDEFFGIYNGMSDHFTQSMNNVYDLHDKYYHVVNKNKIYSTHLYTSKFLEKINNHRFISPKEKPFFAQLSYQNLHTPLSAPDKYIKKCDHIVNGNRRKYCGMLMTVDESIKNITAYFKETGLWDNTIIFVTTDNGGQVWAGALNHPLKGGKNDMYEGGVKGVAFFSGGYLEKHGVKGSTTYDGLMHVSDIYPTLLGFINKNNQNDVSNFVQRHKIDGKDMSKLISSQKCPVDKFIIMHNAINDITGDFLITARQNQWKIIKGFAGDSTSRSNYDHLENPGEDFVDRQLYKLANNAENYVPIFGEFVREFRKIIRFWNTEDKLYNINDDPYEKTNLLYGKRVDVLTKHKIHNKEYQKIFDKIIDLIKNNTDISQKQYPHTHMDPNYKHTCFNDVCFFDTWLENQPSYQTDGFVKWYIKKSIGLDGGVGAKRTFLILVLCGIIGFLCMFGYLTVQNNRRIAEIDRRYARLEQNTY